MAKLERTISHVDFNGLIYRIEQGILNGSATAELEDSSDYENGDTRVAVRVFERYSAIGSNRVSLNVTLVQSGGVFSPIFVSGITSGGSQAMVFKINTIGEETFLDKLREILDEYGR
ncbi:MAG: hypothetical protein IJP37_00740 [Clostridia bacterium]|nr:hypothetical protein [Clostridia bacterium]MBR0025661.1 hypothetical protein [Clostridia bacterium]